LATFGTIIKWACLRGKTLSLFKEKIEAAGFKEIKPGFYDTHDWDAIRSWVKELAQKARA
jgi:hypothetical protein